MISLKVETGIDAKIRAFSPALNRATKKAVLKWYKDVFPDHFKTGMSRKYRYQPRKRRYKREKFRDKGSRTNLVYSGYARKILNLHMRVTGTKGNVTGRFTTNQTIKYIWKRPEGHPDMIKELKTVTDKETEVIGADVKKGTISEMDSVKKRKTIK